MTRKGDCLLGKQGFASSDGEQNTGEVVVMFSTNKPYRTSANVSKLCPEQNDDNIHITIREGSIARKIPGCVVML